MSLFALAFVIVAQVNDPAGDMPPILDAPPVEKKIEPKPLEPLQPMPDEQPPVLTPKKKGQSKVPLTSPAPPPDAKATADEIAWAAGAGGIATGLCSACACGWVPFFGVPVVGAATALGAAGGGLYGAKDKPGWGTAILVNASIAGAGGLIGAGVGTGIMAIAVLSAPQANNPALIYGAIGAAVLLSAAGAVGGAIGGAYAIGSFPPSEEEAAPNAPRTRPKPAKPDDGKTVARY